MPGPEVEADSATEETVQVSAGGLAGVIMAVGESWMKVKCTTLSQPCQFCKWMYCWAGGQYCCPPTVTQLLPQTVAA